MANEPNNKILEKNLASLKKKNSTLAQRILSVNKKPDISIISSSNGSPTLLKNGFAIHSKYDPVREAKDWVNFHKDKISMYETLVVLGFGLGYHVIEILRNENIKVTVFEPRVDILRLAFECFDFTPYFDKITFVIDDCIPRTKGGFAILEHKPSVKLNETYFLNIRQKLESLKRINRGLKILVFGPIYGGATSLAKFCSSALKRLGHDVDFMDNSIFRKTLSFIKKITKNREHREQLFQVLTRFLSEALLARCNEYRPELVFILAEAPVDKISLTKLRESNIPTAYWFVEDYRIMDYWEKIAPFFTYFFTIQKDAFFKKLKASGVKNFNYLPLAASPDFHRKVELSEEEKETFGSDISFVGAGYYNRRKFFEGLIDLDFKIWGNEWNGAKSLEKLIQRNGERIDPEEIVKIFNASKINLNLHSSVHHEGVNPYGDFVNPRTFEIAACEAFQLVDYRSELPSLFEINEEIVCFNDLSDLRKKITYYLKNEKERLDIARRAKERVIKEHTYEHRMEQMINFILDRGLRCPEWNRGKKDLEYLLEKAKSHEELSHFFAGYKEKTAELGLEDIVEDIQSGKGSLSDVEKIFLFINSVRDIYMPKIEALKWKTYSS